MFHAKVLEKGEKCGFRAILGSEQKTVVLLVSIALQFLFCALSDPQQSVPVGDILQ